MEKRKRLLTASVAQKALSALTGLLLCGFLVAHLAGNLSLYLGRGQAFNAYANFLNGIPVLLVFELVLLALILGHAYLGLRIWRQNKLARPHNYAQRRWTKDSKNLEGPHKSRKSVSSTTMAVSGSFTLLFILVHIWHFKYGAPFIPVTPQRSGLVGQAAQDVAKDSQSATIQDRENGTATSVLAQGGPHARDLAGEVTSAFKNPIIVTLYVISLLLLALHLNHGFSSAFQSVGIGGYNRIWMWAGRIFTVVIMGGFISIPLWVYFFRK